MTPHAYASSPSSNAAGKAPLSAPDHRPRVRSESLFRNGHSELVIEHGDQCYRLRLTRQGKLLLHK